MKRDPSGHGFSHLGKDGVFRTLAHDYTVLDARGLNPGQIAEFLALMPLELEPTKEEDFRGVDGTKVTNHKDLFDPAPGILPSKPTEDKRAETQQVIKELNEKRGKDAGQEA